MSTQADRILVSKMIERLREIVLDDGLAITDNDEIADLLMVAEYSIGCDRFKKRASLAEAAIGFAAGEYCGDMGYHFNEKSDVIDYLLDSLVDYGVFERLDGDNHTVYMRV